MKLKTILKEIQIKPSIFSGHYKEVVAKCLVPNEILDLEQVIYLIDLGNYLTLLPAEYDCLYLFPKKNFEILEIKYDNVSKHSIQFLKKLAEKKVVIL